MKYLKLVNVPISEFSKHAKLSNGEKRIPWTECGFSLSVIMAKAVQFEDSDGNFINYLPIDKVTKVRELIAKMSGILSQDGFSAEVVTEVAGSEDQPTWLVRREASKRKQAVRYERRKKAISIDADKPE